MTCFGFVGKKEIEVVRKDMETKTKAMQDDHNSCKARMEATMADLEAKAQQLQTSLDAANKSIGEHEAAAATQSAKMRELEAAKMRELEAANENKDSMQTMLETKIQTLVQERDSATTSHQDAERKIAQLEQDHQLASKASIDEANSIRATFEAQIRSLEDDSDNLGASLAKKIAELQEGQEASKRATENADLLAKKICELEQEIASAAINQEASKTALEARINELEQALASSVASDTDAQTMRASYEAKIRDLEQEVQDATVLRNEDVVITDEKRADLDSKITALEEKVGKTEEEMTLSSSAEKDTCDETAKSEVLQEKIVAELAPLPQTTSELTQHSER